MENEKKVCLSDRHEGTSGTIVKKSVFPGSNSFCDSISGGRNHLRNPAKPVRHPGDGGPWHSRCGGAGPHHGGSTCPTYGRPSDRTHDPFHGPSPGPSSPHSLPSRLAPGSLPYARWDTCGRGPRSPPNGARQQVPGRPSSDVSKTLCRSTRNLGTRSGPLFLYSVPAYNTSTTSDPGRPRTVLSRPELLETSGPPCPQRQNEWVGPAQTVSPTSAHLRSSTT